MKTVAISAMSNDFYTALGGDYDRMTRFAERLESERPTVDALVARLSTRRALDAGCGSGIHAVLLAQAGVETAAVDLSPAMVERTQEHAHAVGVALTCRVASMTDLPQHFRDGSVDTVLCLGNSLPHLLNERLLARAAHAFAHVLEPGGHLVLQWLNYERFLAQGQRVVAARREGDEEWIRFHDFLENGLLRFNVMHLVWEGPKARSDVNSTLLFPWPRNAVADALVEAGFAPPVEYANLTFEAFDVEASRNVVMVAKRKG